MEPEVRQCVGTAEVVVPAQAPAADREGAEEGQAAQAA